MGSQGHIFRSWKESGTGECGGSEVVKVAEFSGGSFPEERKTGFFQQTRKNESELAMGAIEVILSRITSWKGLCGVSH